MNARIRSASVPRVSTDPARWVFGSVLNPTRGHRRLKVEPAFLTDDELDHVREAIEAERDRRDEAEARKRYEESRRTVASLRVSAERVRCGTPGCHCAAGQLHGPYWYAYLTTGDGRTIKRYVGNAPNAGAAERLAGKKARAAGLRLGSDPSSSTPPRRAARTR